jgi:hypothetical protein
MDPRGREPGRSTSSALKGSQREEDRYAGKEMKTKGIFGERKPVSGCKFMDGTKRAR